MLFYKFLKDKSGELTQVWVAAQSPNKVSKRVLLDLSIAVLLPHLSSSTDLLEEHCRP